MRAPSFTKGPAYTPTAREMARDYVPPNPPRRNYSPPTEPTHVLTGAAPRLPRVGQVALLAPAKAEQARQRGVQSRTLKQAASLGVMTVPRAGTQVAVLVGLLRAQPRDWDAGELARAAGLDAPARVGSILWRWVKAGYVLATPVPGRYRCALYRWIGPPAPATGGASARPGAHEEERE